MTASRRTDHVQIARVLGIPIHLHFSWVIVFGLIVWTLATGYFPAHDPDLPAWSNWAKGLAASLLFFVSILLHELGHALMALREGLRTRSITLFIFGGVAQLEKDAQDGRSELRIAAAGPLVSLALAGLFHLCTVLPFASPGAVAVARYLAERSLPMKAVGWAALESQPWRDAACGRCSIPIRIRTISAAMRPCNGSSAVASSFPPASRSTSSTGTRMRCCLRRLRSAATVSATMPSCAPATRWSWAGSSGGRTPRPATTWTRWCSTVPKPGC